MAYPLPCFPGILQKKINTVDKAGKNKKLILDFLRTLNEAENKLQILSRYTSDPKLIERITFLEQAFPQYKVKVDEVTAEEDRVIVRALFVGKHHGAANGVAPTGETIELSYAIGYQIRNSKIIAHWMITDWLELVGKN